MDTSPKVEFLRQFLFTDKVFKRVMLNLILHNPLFQGLMQKTPKVYSAQNPMLVRQACKTLSDSWKHGNPREYLESLDTDLKNCLICNLISDISAEAIADMGLIEV